MIGMIERVARAMFEDSHEETWDEATDLQRSIYLNDADIAITAMDQWHFEAASS